jgi:hypothetical protein
MIVKLPNIKFYRKQLIGSEIVSCVHTTTLIGAQHGYERDYKCFPLLNWKKYCISISIYDLYQVINIKAFQTEFRYKKFTILFVVCNAAKFLAGPLPRGPGAEKYSVK